MPVVHVARNGDHEVPTNESENPSMVKWEGRFVSARSEASTVGGNGRFSRFLARLVDSYANFILRPIVKVLILAVFTGLLLLGAWAASQQSQEFDFRSLMPPDSYVTTYFSALDVHFSGGVATSSSPTMISVGVLIVPSWS